MNVESICKKAAGLALLASVAAASAGCVQVQGFLNYPFVSVKYMKQGVVVSDIRHTFEYDALGNAETIKIGRHFRMVDNECDGRVDLIERNQDSFQRGEAGTEDLFALADEKWQTVRAYLHAGRFRTQRAGMLRDSPGSIVSELD